ncbi:hypothetical protein VNI00_012977 [Paramarasmius palmivorus]|uniref:Uncharacterized protein n=1 Tax=Paramarasmius palmivorus TaxID=297713 RepID=A0AAW0C171_9AGAR
MAFVGSSSISIAGDAVNVVHGDQVNNTVVIRKARKKIKTEATLYDEFRNVRLGDIYRTREVGQSTVPIYYKIPRTNVEQSVAIAKVQDTDTSSKYTVVTYRGPNAHIVRIQSEPQSINRNSSS